MSLVEQVLRTDPAGAYAGMDFASRDSYRHAVETIAKASGCPEDTVASQAVALAAAGPAPAGGDREAHVGYYLLDRGLPALEQAMGANLAPAAAMRRWASGSALSLYLGTTTVLTLVLAVGLLAQARAEALPAWALVPLAVLATLATGQLAIALVNWLMPLLASPRRLPRMDYSEGIPAAAINASITYMKAAREGSLYATAEEFAKNPKLATYIVTITDDTGDRIALFQGMVYRKRVNK